LATVAPKAPPKPSANRIKPRYQALADELRNEILRGDYPEGEFPTESVLCARFEVSRFTVREALRTLTEEGLISRRRGSGTLVQPASARGGALHQPLSNVAEILQYARDTTFDFARQHDGGLPPWIEEQIGWTDTGRWARYYGVRSDSDGVPLAITTAFVSGVLDNYLELIKPNGGAIFRQIEAHAGVKVASVTQDITACAATHEQAATLNIAEGDPVLRIIRCYVDGKGRTFEISVSYHPGARFAYAMHMEVEG
jgi:GntR family transcriptional regulator